MVEPKIKPDIGLGSVVNIMEEELRHRYQLKREELDMQDIWKATRPSVQKSKKVYTRKKKHKSKKN